MADEKKVLIWKIMDILYGWYKAKREKDYNYSSIEELQSIYDKLTVQGKPKTRRVVNSERFTKFYKQIIEADTMQEAIEKAEEIGDRQEFDESWHGDSETTAEEILDDEEALHIVNESEEREKRKWKVLDFLSYSDIMVERCLEEEDENIKDEVMWMIMDI